MMEATSYTGSEEAFSGQVMAGTVTDEERLAEIIVSLMRNNREVRKAILQVVMSCPEIVREY